MIPDFPATIRRVRVDERKTVKEQKAQEQKIERLYAKLRREGWEVNRKPPGHPNHVWGIDITYIRLKQGWMYLVAVIDWYSRYIVSWQLNDTLELPFVLTAVRSALKQAKPKIWNSDQGSHFTSDQYIGLLKEAEIQISMDGKNRALDNIITERFWMTLKYDHVYLHEYSSPIEARQQIGNFIREHNYDRPHQSLSYLTPAEVYFQQERSTLYHPAAI